MATQKELLELADLFIQNEETLAEFYLACQDLFPSYREQFLDLAKQEEGHARIFAQVKAAIQEKPGAFSPGRFFPQTLQVMIAGIRQKIGELRERKLNSNYALTYMMDTENSLLEGEIAKAFQTEDNQVRELLDTVQRATAAHRETLRAILLQERK
ncbi:MAG: hypothetical protein GX442_14725 [Candidatus Riflebacteria bacterium]|nr:hypothetical protein [Candidatus Riflebacteria bacterium]